MATVKELKDALVTEQTKAVELANQALSAIDTIANLSMWAFGVMAVAVSILGLLGYRNVLRSANRAAEEVATTRLDSYIKSKEFRNAMQIAVREEVRERVKDKVIIANLTEEKGGDEPDPFPSVEEAK